MEKQVVIFEEGTNIVLNGKLTIEYERCGHTS